MMLGGDRSELRRRRRRTFDRGVPPESNAAPTLTLPLQEENQENTETAVDAAHPQRRRGRHRWRPTWLRLWRLYGHASTLGAIAAIVLAPHPLVQQQQSVSSPSASARGGLSTGGSVFFDGSVVAVINDPRDAGAGAGGKDNKNHWLRNLGIGNELSANAPDRNTHKPHKHGHAEFPLAWFKWRFPDHQGDRSRRGAPPASKPQWWASLLTRVQTLLDQALLRWPPSVAAVTDLLDKVLGSTVRLIAVTNGLLAYTFWLHGAVADWFLGVAAPVALAATPPAGGAGHQHQHQSHRGPRNSLRGYLLFKILLMSAVLAPDVLDLLILLGWYTLIAFLRSLAQACHAATLRLEAAQVLTVVPTAVDFAAMADGGPGDGSGTQIDESRLQPPLFVATSPLRMLRLGIVQLLVLVLLGDIAAAVACAALFHGAGWGTVWLLTCDNALLLLEALGFGLVFLAQVWEQQHFQQAQAAEADLARRNRRAQRRLQRELLVSSSTVVGLELSLREFLDENERDDEVDELTEEAEDLFGESTEAATAAGIGALEQRLEVMDQLHARRLSVLDTTVFVLQLMTQLLTIAHFLHIWRLHGVQFTLIDGVLALHVYSALSLFSRKVADRRKLHRITRELNVRFDDATEMELRKAAAAGDVCCICLAGLNSTAQVKRVGCNHLYHTHCLREVVERAGALEAARCPLCRAHLLDGRQSPLGVPALGRVGDLRPPVNAVAPPAPAGPAELDAVPRENERALLRFSTDDFIPAWLPLPSFSFEVVRRQVPDQSAVAVRGGPPEPVPHEPGPMEEPPRPSLLHRLLALAGAAAAAGAPLSPAEEAAALDRLAELFPQQDRATLARDLRLLGSPEAVAERVLAADASAMTAGRD